MELMINVVHGQYNSGEIGCCPQEEKHSIFEDLVWCGHHDYVSSQNMRRLRCTHHQHCMQLFNNQPLLVRQLKLS